MQTLTTQGQGTGNNSVIGAVGSIPKTVTCFACNGFGHVAKQCPTRNNIKVNDQLSAKICYFCQKPGHIARNCNNPRPRLGPGQVDRRNQGTHFPNRKPVVCYRCGKEGHIARLCQTTWDNTKGFVQTPEKGSDSQQNQSKIRMSTISPVSKRKTLMVEAQINGKPKLCIVDTGASISLVSRDEWQLLKENNSSLTPSDIVAEAANNSPIGIIGKTALNVKVDPGNMTSHEFYVASDMISEIILGLDWLMNNKVTVDLSRMVLKFPDLSTKPLSVFDSCVSDPLAVVLHEDIEVPAKHEVLQTARVRNPTISESVLEPNMNLSGKGVLVARVVVQPKEQRVPIQIINPGTEPVKLYKGMKVGSLQHVDDIDMSDPIFAPEDSPKDVRFQLDHLQPEQKTKMGHLLNSYQDIFATGSGELGLTSVTQHKIEIQDAVPVKQLPRRLPNALRPVVEEQVSEMLEKEVIQPSNSPWASPIVLVRKKDGTWRFCIDFRKLNEVTIKDAFPLPQIADLVDSLSGHKYFSTLDLASGYWQVPMEESSQEKTTFVIPGGGHFEFLRMPFGLTNAVPTFQRLMSVVLEGLLPLRCLVYLDDVLVIGRSFEQHLENLESVLKAISDAGLKLKLAKCQFAQSTVDFLGFTISDSGLAPDPKKVEAISRYPTPTDLTELRRFLGMASYYRRFISGFSDIATPLNRLTQKDVPFVWDKNCETAFQTLKEQLVSSPVLAFPETDGDYILYTDASNIGVGAVLAQEDGEGRERVISYASKALSGSEKNWTTTEKEAYVVVWALQYFHPYVYGRKVVIYTDHKALKWLKNIKHPNGKLARWILKLEEYDYTIEHKSGQMMQHADALSRAPVNSIRISTLSWTEFEETQNLDEDISLVKRWALNGRRPDKKPDDASPMLKSLFNVFESLVVEKNVLCRNWVDEEGKGTLQIVVPKFASPAIMKDAHQQVGHLGIAKTFEMIQRGFYWPGFYKDVETFCKSCEICARNKVVQKPRSPMKPIDIVPVPFYMVGVDLIGPLKLTRQGNKYILSIIDYYTKYAEAIALPNQEAETVVRTLEQVFARHGMPSVLLTDQGRNFESHLVTRCVSCLE